LGGFILAIVSGFHTYKSSMTGVIGTRLINAVLGRYSLPLLLPQTCDINIACLKEGTSYFITYASGDISWDVCTVCLNHMEIEFSGFR
jgi:hypothetical protein